MELSQVHIYCDGACSPNPGLGGWGALLIALDHDGHTRELSGAEHATTNNRMELTAAIMALRALKRPCEVTLHTDSQYLRNAFEQGWLRNWQRNGWLTRAKTPVLNEDLWRELLELDGLHCIAWTWVRGHADNVLHNRVDALAVAARKSLVT
ncbi:MAG TPA: ribonuclease HI [Tepidiformaceae bacterium]|nr:ribonuclease HI [Tepidiformaceae bacterium]